MHSDGVSNMGFGQVLAELEVQAAYMQESGGHCINPTRDTS